MSTRNIRYVFQCTLKVKTNNVSRLTLLILAMFCVPTVRTQSYELTASVVQRTVFLAQSGRINANQRWNSDSRDESCSKLWFCIMKFVTLSGLWCMKTMTLDISDMMLIPHISERRFAFIFGVKWSGSASVTPLRKPQASTGSWNITSRSYPSGMEKQILRLR